MYRPALFHTQGMEYYSIPEETIVAPARPLPRLLFFLPRVVTRTEPTQSNRFVKPRQRERRSESRTRWWPARRAAALTRGCARPATNQPRAHPGGAPPLLPPPDRRPGAHLTARKGSGHGDFLLPWTELTLSGSEAGSRVGFFPSMLL
jgi:hypothetical protein